MSLSFQKYRGTVGLNGPIALLLMVKVASVSSLEEDERFALGGVSVLVPKQRISPDHA